MLSWHWIYQFLEVYGKAEYIVGVVLQCLAAGFCTIRTMKDTQLVGLNDGTCLGCILLPDVVLVESLPEVVVYAPPTATYVCTDPIFLHGLLMLAASLGFALISVQ